MNKYITSILGISLFVGFVTYATVQTKQQEAQTLLNQESSITEKTKIPENNSNILPIQSSDQTSAIIETNPLTKEKPTAVKKVNNPKYNDDDTEREYDD